MAAILLAPPVAFLIYMVLVGVLAGFGRILAPSGEVSPAKASTYASGEASPVAPAVPGYRPFFKVALFFAILHLGVLMLGSGSLAPIMGVYLIGLVLALVALILG
jgi:NADH:ubiquinone oxidoreductase subunit 3 (subunit A)